jgi:glutamate-5-semialdehyde dehydrogenase
MNTLSNDKELQTTNKSLQKKVDWICYSAKKAKENISKLNTEEKNAILSELINQLILNKNKLIIENQKDLENAKKMNLSKSLIERIKINDKVFSEMILGIETIIKLKDPIGEELDSKILENGLILKKVSVSLGVILVIYESRPNVTIDVASICIKSGNASILKGGKECKNTNAILVECIKNSFKSFNSTRVDSAKTNNSTRVDSNIVQYVKERECVSLLLKRNDSIDVVIPRGGKELIEAVTASTTIATIKHYQGICNIFVDKEADFHKAIKIILNAKTQKASACNSVENLLVDKIIAKDFLRVINEQFISNEVEVRGCINTTKIISCKKATKKDFSTEYLDKIISIKIVNGSNEAINFINEFGSKHSDSIITENEKTAKLFLNNVDSAVVYWNASTRFTDGQQFGMGCEIGISTDKLHARGPMGLKELTSYKYKIFGNGQIRK